MRNELAAALKWREDGEYYKSSGVLMELVQSYPEDSFILYQYAWSLDLLGEERKAVLFYEKAIQLGLPEAELEGALLGLGSTYRTLGDYEKASDIFSQAIQKYPANRALQVFYAMTLYNLENHAKAMELLLTALVETTMDESILQYKKAITFYSDKLNESWK
ncbi:tetratricopeptide repeat protein [Niallia sp. MER 6]|uniref:tetratricopeptide repeat protein n=1 Tax=unclassified Niallia TaxID=2837522 RepID=UPI002041754D|nr:tetratricopeptide repeat protein [Niallia sp. MER 6]MCM3033385.1 tetratricopeptide repeat protein [Niallia sp. MER 6]